MSWGTYISPTKLYFFSLLFLIWISDTSEPEEGACRPLPHFAPGRFSASGANSGRCRWSPLGSMNYHDFAHPFNGLERIYVFWANKLQQLNISDSQDGKRISLDTKSCIGNEMVEFLPLIRCEESQLHVWLLSVWLMEANGPALSDLAIQMEELKC